MQKGRGREGKRWPPRGTGLTSKQREPLDSHFDKSELKYLILSDVRRPWSGQGPWRGLPHYKTFSGPLATHALMFKALWAGHRLPETTAAPGRGVSLWV